MSKLFLAAGVAALAIASAAAAKPGGNGGGHGGGDGGPHGGGGGPPAFAGGGGGGHGNGGGGPHGGGAAPAFFGGGGGHGHGGGGGGPAPVFMGGGGGRGHGGGGGGFAPMFAGGGGHGHGHGGGFAAPRQQARAFAGGGRGHGGQSFAMGGGGRGHGHAAQAYRVSGGGRGHGHGGQALAMRGGGRNHGGQAVAMHGGGRGHGQAGQFAQQGRGFAPQQMRGSGGQQARFAGRQQLQGNRAQQAPQQQAFANQQLGGRAFNGNGDRLANGQFAQNFNPAPYQALSYGNNVQVLPVPQVQQFIGVPVAQVAGLSPLPATIQYLYPDTPNYYYQYGDGYLYQVDRGTSLIDALIPLLAGGYLPGQYLPQPYMASYVPDYYGMNSFYPDYGDICNRYANGVVYEVDCETGYVEDVIPMYAGGYGIGQILPTAYDYYNVPVQYRSVYYDTPEYGYWYAPGAIYQYDQRTSLITSVAALMAPGFTVGQALPVGYDVYNVPYAYRATYYDTPNAWYRYNNGYIYQVDPVTQIVTAVVASLLT